MIVSVEDFFCICADVALLEFSAKIKCEPTLGSTKTRIPKMSIIGSKRLARSHNS
jgi:hypothetical protein